MKPPIKTFASVVVLGLFLLIGWASSYEDDDGYNFVDVSLQNDSDSCTVTAISLIYRARRNNDDTLSLAGYELAPGDTIWETWEKFEYKKLNYTCNCPSDTTLHSDDVAFDSIYYQPLNIDCD